ncbi:hypothetical protein M0R04_14355 [Candidatus Dojkabacteria bacterium]|jgi:hypothetical protein|nr:hypothetical protein [Candidatus Dojkabacteria bacterium]
MKTITITFDKNTARHILAYDIDCGSCHLHKFEADGAKSKPRFHCPYNRKFRNLLLTLEVKEEG